MFAAIAQHTTQAYTIQSIPESPDIAPSNSSSLTSKLNKTFDSTWCLHFILHIKISMHVEMASQGKNLICIQIIEHHFILF